MTPAEFRAALAELNMSQLGWARRWRCGERQVRRWADPAHTSPLPGWLAVAVEAERRLAAAGRDAA